MSHGILARNFEWMLRELATRGHRVHVALDQMNKRGISDTNRVVEQVARDHDAFTFGPSPAREAASISFAGRAFRLVLDFVRYFEPGYVDSDKPRARMAARIPRPVRALATPLLQTRRGRASIRGLLQLADEGVPADASIEEFMRSFAPDAIVVSPLVDPGSPQTDYLRCSRQLGVPSLVAVHSWDNLTVKGGIHELPDALAVWNETQRQEAIRLHHVPPERVVVTGGAAYDHWFDWKPSSTRNEFCEAYGLDPDEPYLLYLGSSRFIAPDESGFIREWDQRIRELSRDLEDVQVVVRPHPLNPFVGAVPEGVTLAAARDLEPFDRDSRAHYFDAVFHSAAVVGVLTSGMIEAAIVDRPVHTVVTERYRDTQRSTVHFRHLLPENGGMMIVGRNYEEHAQQLAASLRGGTPTANASFVSAFVRPSGTGSSASVALADTVEALAGARAARDRSLARRAAGTALAHVGWAFVRLLQLAHRQAARGADRSMGVGP